MKFKFNKKQSLFDGGNPWTKWYAWHPVRISNCEMGWLMQTERRLSGRWKGARHKLVWEYREVMCPVARRAMEARELQREVQMYGQGYAEDAVADAGYGNPAVPVGMWLAVDNQLHNIPQAEPQVDRAIF